MKKSANRFVVLGIAGIFIAAGIGLGYYLNLQRTTVVNQRKTLINLQQEASDMDSLVRQYREVEPRVTEIGKAVPATSVDVASFLQDVSASASISATQVEMIVNDVQPEHQTRDGQLVQVAINVSGTYANTVKFVHRISNLPYYFTVDTLSIKPNAAGELETKMNILLNTTYHET